MKEESSLAYKSFKENLARYFNLKFIKISFLIAFLLSFFIFGLHFCKPNSVLANLVGLFGLALGLVGLWWLLNSRREVWFFTGCFVGLFWFYWISFSLRYFDIMWAIGFEILFISLAYGVIFGVIGWFENKLLRAALLVAVGYLYPLDFNWLNFEILFSQTPFYPSPFSLFAVLVGLAFLSLWRGALLVAALVGSLGVFWEEERAQTSLNIALLNTSTPQDFKWQQDNAGQIISQNFALIDEAIKSNADLVVLPETAFYLPLNKNTILLDELKKRSQKAAILTGALAYENGKAFNSAFLFQNGEMKRFDKVVLVPFGERNPLPQPLAGVVERLFFGQESEFSPANNISNYSVGGEMFRNAICFEATRPEFYEDAPKFIVAISSLAWFEPSTARTLQRLLITRLERLNGVKVFHAINAG